MGERFRLKASFNISSFPPEIQIILRAMKKYGIILADNGSPWFISGAPDSRWNDDNLHTLGLLAGSNFEAVDATVLRVDPNSGEALQSGVAVTVTPSSASIRTGRSQTFTAIVTGAPNSVAWSVNWIPGGDAVVGQIDSMGHYFAPSTVPNPATLTVRAASTASPASSGGSSVTILPLPAITSVTPSPVPVGNFTLAIDGVGYSPGSVVSFDGASLATTFSSSTRLTAGGSAPTPQTAVPVIVTTPDGEVSNAFSVGVSAPPSVSITIAPLSVTVRVTRTQQFSATVHGSSNTTVIWKVNGIHGGNSTVGTVTSAGLYRAPKFVPSPARITVSATAAADPSRTASASATISKK
jgi:hypothetical protein